mmetsp:Transcript_28850/g.83326  ORF Transcript_28850/g.83326 Transcript_28850/m.83326 type:complete len:227 (-) Transcript_28850:268-948(-)
MSVRQLLGGSFLLLGELGQLLLDGFDLLVHLLRSVAQQTRSLCVELLFVVSPVGQLGPQLLHLGLLLLLGMLGALYLLPQRLHLLPVGVLLLTQPAQLVSGLLQGFLALLEACVDVVGLLLAALLVGYHLLKGRLLTLKRLLLVIQLRIRHHRLQPQLVRDLVFELSHVSGYLVLVLELTLRLCALLDAAAEFVLRLFVFLLFLLELLEAHAEASGAHKHVIQLDP